MLTVVEPSGKSTAYSYDTAGNRASQTETEGSDVTATTYIYDSQNRLTRTTENLNGTLVKTVDYAYDNNGNLLTVTSVTYTDGIAGAPVLEQNNTYDLLNQLVQTITSDGTTVINTYNGDGLRVGKSVNASLTRYLYEYDKVILELNALGDQTGRNVYGLNLISRTFGEDTFFYFYNGHADVTALLAADGTIAATYYYDAFGNILDQTGTVTSNILYAGYQYDPETGLYYLNARMYDPVTARFIQEDSYLGSRNDALSLNLYTYCHNEPMMYSDPTGHSWWSAAASWAGATVSKVAGAAVSIAKKYLKARSNAYSFVSTQYAASVANINVGISGRIDSLLTSTGIGKENVAANHLATQAKMNIGMIEGAFQWGIEGVELLRRAWTRLPALQAC